ncbi:unnamed protein product [Caenorhabditis sp. 36 PRJEB53466]|nr:unnamed protein product [Caenorhabditis sp. 36 PRJEB53466]
MFADTKSKVTESDGHSRQTVLRPKSPLYHLDAMIPKSSSFDEIAKSSRGRIRRTQSEEGSDIFDYSDNGISRSVSQFSGILTIAPTICAETSTDFGAENEGIKRKFIGFIKKHLQTIPSMLTSPTDPKSQENGSQPANSAEEDVEKTFEATAAASTTLSKSEKDPKKMMDSDSAVFEIDELNSTIAPSSSRQCIVPNDLECAPVAVRKPKKATAQRTEFHPRPPFSCVPIYTAILLGLLIVLIFGAVTTIIDMRPAFIYGADENSGNSSQPFVSFSTLKPQ